MTTEPGGTMRCPYCKKEGPHQHLTMDLVPWRDERAAWLHGTKASAGPCSRCEKRGHKPFDCRPDFYFDDQIQTDLAWVEGIIGRSPYSPDPAAPAPSEGTRASDALCVCGHPHPAATDKDDGSCRDPACPCGAFRAAPSEGTAEGMPEEIVRLIEEHETAAIDFGECPQPEDDLPAFRAAEDKCDAARAALESAILRHLAPSPIPREEALPSDIEITHFDIRGIERPGRVYSTPAHDGTDRRVVAFNAPIPRDALYDAAGKPRLSTHWSGLPTMFLYVSDFAEALALAREIGAAHKAGNVDTYIGRWKREGEEARALSSPADGEVARG